MSSLDVQPFSKTLQGLDKLIYQLELNLGREHTVKPQQENPGNSQPESKSENPLKEKTQSNENAQKSEKPEEKKEKNAKKEKKQVKESSKPDESKEEKKVSHEKKSQEKPKAETSKTPDLLQLFPNLDIRVGRIIECWKHPDSEKLYCEKIDLGYEIREIASGVQKQIPLENMKGLVIIVANLKPKKLAGFMSNGMVMMASNQDHTVIELLRPEEGTQLGERVFIDGLENIVNEKAKELNPKQNILEKCLEVMKTDAEATACFGDKKLKTSKGVIKSQTLINSNIS